MRTLYCGQTDYAVSIIFERFTSPTAVREFFFFTIFFETRIIYTVYDVYYNNNIIIIIIYNIIQQCNSCIAAAVGETAAGATSSCASR